jgi:hypothetical protein
MENFNIRYQPTRPDNKERINQPDIKSKMAHTIKCLHQDPNGPYTDWKDGRPSMSRENIIASNKSRDPTIQSENVRKGILKKLEDPAYIVAREEGNKKKYKSIQDPNGKIWPSRKDAAEAWKMIPQTISKLVKKPNSGWKYT